MREIRKNEVEKAISILTKAFLTNPSVTWVIKNDRKRESRIRELVRYSLHVAQRRKGVFISTRGHGIALCYKLNEQKEGIADYIDQLRLLIRAIGWKKLHAVLHRESYIKSVRPKDKEALYFWYLGVDPAYQGGNDAYEIKNEIFKYADRKQLPIYLETSVEKNFKIYLRYGFINYHTWHIKEQHINLYFMRRMPGTSTGSENLSEKQRC